MNCASEILELLDIPYQVVLLSTGDMGFMLKKLLILRHGYHQKISLEKFQAVHHVEPFSQEEWELNIKVKIATNTLNPEWIRLAVGRLMISLLENNQNKDGSITIPKF